ncbi:RHS repeat domain-containing protein, partial [Alistipes finegoldii]
NSYEPQLYRVFNSGVPQRIFHQNGRLKVIVRKNAMGEITHRTDYQYLLDEKSCDTIRGFHVTSFASSFLFTPYSHYAEWWYLDNERTTVWENGKPITSNTKYEYNNDYRKQVSKTTTYADREVVREESKHTCDVPTYSHMADMNRIFPVENNRYRNGKFVFGTRNDYDENLVVGNISQKTAEQPNYESRIRIKWYNGLYNPVYYVKDGTENVVCLWSYSGEYPIAEIKNATMDDVLKALGQEQGDLAYFTTLAKQTVPDMTPINSLRAKLPDAQVWTYTYKSLVGMLTVTDPAGKTAYYDYDSFGRLTGMRDNDGSTIQSFDYHYKQ